MLSPTRRATDSFDRCVGTPSRVQVRRDAILATLFADLSVKNFLFFVSRAFRDCGGVGGAWSRRVGRGVAIEGDDDWCAAPGGWTD